MKILDFIVCDDIRQEVGDKVTLVGVYAGSLIIKGPEEINWPQTVRIGFFLRFVMETGDAFPDRFQARFVSEGEEVTIFEGPMSLSEEYTYFQMVLMSNAFVIPRPGELTFKVVFLNGESILHTLQPDYRLSVIEEEQEPKKQSGRKK